MRLLRVAALELKDKALLLVVGLVCGLAATLIPILRGLQGPELAENQGGIAFVLALGTVAVTALILGSGLVGPDLQEGRLGFFFARPLRSFDLWGGRFLAALVITQAGGLLCLLPLLRFSGEIVAVAAALGVLLLLGLAGLLLANAVSIALRARTAWLVLDFAALLAGLLGFIWLLRQLHGAGDHPRVVSWTAFGILMGLLLLAGIIGLAQGRVSLARGHRAASLVLAGGILLALAAAAVFQQAAFGAKDLQKLKVWYAQAGDKGPWCILGAEPEPKRMQKYLHNVDTGSTRRIATSDAVISLDGRRAAWQSAPGLPIPGIDTIWIADLDATSMKVWSLPAPRVSREEFIRNRALAISPEGDRLAMAGDEAVAVFSLESGAVLARHAYPNRLSEPRNMGFLSNGDLRIYGIEKAGAERLGVIYEVRMAVGLLLKTGEFPTGFDLLGLRRDPATESLIWGLNTPSSRTLLLLDARTGSEKSMLSKIETPGTCTANFLPGGRIACLEVSEGIARLRLLDPEGKPLWETPLVKGLAPRPRDRYRASVAWDPQRQLLRAKVEWGRFNSREGRLFLVDPARRSFVESSEGLRPERSLSGIRGFHGPILSGSFEASLRITEWQQLVRIAPDGSRKVLVGPE